MAADIVFAASVLPDAFTETPYLAAIPFYGNASAVTACSVTSGSLPAGLSLSAAYAAVSGTIAYNAADGLYSFTVSITDSSGTASQAFTMNVHYLEADPDLTAGMLAILREGPPNPGPGLPAALAALAAAEAASLPVPSGTPSADYVPLYVGPSNATEWGAQSGGGGGGAVSSVFGRTGAVTAQSGDYTAAEVGADASGAAAAAQAASTPVLTQTPVKTGNYTASANQIVPVNTTSGSVTVKLPQAPANGTVNAVKDIILGTGYTLTVQTQGSDVINKSGGGTSLTETLVNQGVLLQYDSGIWIDLADDLPLSQLETLFLQTANSLSELTATASTARANLGLGSAATQSTSAFDAAGAASAAQAASTPLLARVLVTASGSPYAASANQVISVDTTLGSVIIDLPNGPAAGTLNAIKQIIMGSGYSVTVTCQGSDVINKAGGGTAQTLTLSSQGSLLHYSGTSNGSIWTVLADDLPLGQLETVFAALAGATFTGWTAPAVVTLADASTVSINAAAGNDFRLLTTSGVGSTRQLGTPSNPVDGQRIDVMVTQPSSGGPCALTYGSGYLFSSSLAQPTLSTTAGYTDLLGFIYNAALAKWLFVAFLAGFA
jgi:predicted membrane protein